ncbi:hypothetical protein SNEBB_001514 [Seison nebaliae]|nr:hypothetical protein SNEBB_001514 [Seison nebaliae]
MKTPKVSNNYRIDMEQILKESHQAIHQVLTSQHQLLSPVSNKLVNQLQNNLHMVTPSKRKAFQPKDSTPIIESAKKLKSIMKNKFGKQTTPKAKIFTDNQTDHMAEYLMRMVEEDRQNKMKMEEMREEEIRQAEEKQKKNIQIREMKNRRRIRREISCRLSPKRVQRLVAKWNKVNDDVVDVMDDIEETFDEEKIMKKKLPKMGGRMLESSAKRTTPSKRRRQEFPSSDCRTPDKRMKHNLIFTPTRTSSPKRSENLNEFSTIIEEKESIGYHRPIIDNRSDYFLTELEKISNKEKSIEKEEEEEEELKRINSNKIRKSLQMRPMPSLTNLNETNIKNKRNELNNFAGSMDIRKKLKENFDESKKENSSPQQHKEEVVVKQVKFADIPKMTEIKPPMAPGRFTKNSRQYSSLRPSLKMMDVCEAHERKIHMTLAAKKDEYQKRKERRMTTEILNPFAKRRQQQQFRSLLLNGGQCQSNLTASLSSLHSQPSDGKKNKKRHSTFFS